MERFAIKTPRNLTLTYILALELHKDKLNGMPTMEPLFLLKYLLKVDIPMGGL